MAQQAILFDDKPAEGRRPIARVVVHLPVEGVYDYRVPAALAARVAPGVRVRVRFGGRTVTATCTELAAATRLQDPREIISVVDAEPLLSPALLALTRWLADRYQCGWWEAITAALPAAARRGGGARRVLWVRLAIPAAKAAELADEMLSKRPEQARCLRILAEEAGRVEATVLSRRANVSRSPLDTLRKNGFVAFDWLELDHHAMQGLAEPAKAPVVLTAEQDEALRAIIAAVGEEGSPRLLLFGVTGSGKTEVYLRAIKEVVERGMQAVVLVPEISLTPQTVARFRHRFERVAVLHSGLTDAERYAQWRAIRAGAADVIIGARSALFAPIPKLGLIVVDEEHETSFKQQNAPRYVVRDAAFRRGELERCPVVLGTATPSLEAWHEARQGRIRLLRLRQRVGGGRFPDVSVVHMGLHSPRRGGFLSDHLRSAVDGALAAKHQVILFLNRRGFHTAVLCTACGEAVRCRQCEIALTYHRRANRAICHYCGHEEMPPEACPACRSRELRYIGSGTERVEAEVKRSFRDAAVLRMDSDTMATRNAHETALERFRRGEIDILIGTQMIAKGLDFPNVTLVGVISADTSLMLPDFRSSERTFQLIAQVAGRAGRGHDPGRVLVQTFNPDHFAIERAVDADYEGFAESELASRAELGYPPHGRLLRAIFSAAAESDAMRVAREAATALGRAELPGGTAILGPARAPLARISGRFRWHLLIKAAGDAGVEAAGNVLRAVARQLAAANAKAARGSGGRSREQGESGGPRMTLDVDPLSML